MQTKYRTHKCSDINISIIGEKIKIAGWIRTKRNHGSILFIDLVDGSSQVQCIINKKSSLFENLEKIPLESVICIEGIVCQREKNAINTKITTGQIELIVESFEILSQASELPFAIDQENLAEELQLKYRFLYLRNNHMQEMLKFRTRVIDLIRQLMKEIGFLEVQTPILTSSSPEGSRDYVIPSRLHKGKFYALPQAPQQFKQLLMASGIEKYFQIAPCFRDEDSRADRLVGEFYQLDFEMAFATQEDVFFVLEDVLKKIFNTFRSDREIIGNFPKIKYKDAIETYGTDKPDLRNPLCVQDITNQAIVPNIFKKIIDNDGKMLIVTAPVGKKNRNFYEQLQKIMINHGAFGLAWSVLENNSWSGPLTAMFSDEQKINWLKDDHNAIFLITDKSNKAYKLIGILRNELGIQLNLIDQNKYAFCLITDFPMFEFDEEKQMWDFMHNPFSMPQNIDDNIKNILAYQYDIVCNGYELSSGAVRNHDLNLIKKVFEKIGQNTEHLEKNFPVFQAFKYGVPPHAGAAPGIDRIIMLLSDQKNVRNTVAFPLNQKAEDLLMLAPSYVDEKLLKELGIKIL